VVCKSLFTWFGAAGVALVLAGPATPSSFPGLGSLPNGWTHAEINVTVGGTPHTLVLNTGRVQDASASSLTLREADGSVVVVPVSPSTQVVVNGQPGSIASVVPGALAMTLQVDGNPAQRVQANVPPGLAATPLGRIRKRR
jgi:hypothetical protein